MVCIFGSCRVYYGPRNEGPYRPFTFTHSSKVVLQLLKWKDKSEDELKEIYINELFLLSELIKNIDDFLSIMKKVKDYVNKSKVIVIEICSMKEVFYKGLYLLDHRCNKRVIKTEYIPEFPNTDKNLINELIKKEQNREEIINDLNQIVSILYDKKILFLPHYTAKINNKTNQYIENRIEIFKILKDFCYNKNNCILFNHLDYVDDNEDFYLKIDKFLDTCHISWKNRHIITVKLNELINKLNN